MNKFTLLLIVLIGTFIATGAIIVGLANHPAVIKAIVSKYAPQYNITYDSIDGTLMEGVSIRNIRHQKELLTTNLLLKWNPLSLLEKKILFHSLIVDDINITAIQTFAKQFKSSSTKQTTPPNFDIVIKTGRLTLSKWNIGSIQIDNAVLDTERLVFNIQTQSFKSGNASLEAISPLATLKYKAQANANKLQGDGILYATPLLWEKYHIPFDTNDTVPIEVRNLTLSTQNVDIALRAAPKNIWKNNPQIDIRQIDSNLFYHFKENNLLIDSNATIFTPQLKESFLTNHITRDSENGFRYTGELHLEPMILTSDMKKQPLILNYSGDVKGMEASFENREIKANFITPDYSKGELDITTKQAIPLKQWMPKSLEKAKGEINIKTPINLKELTSATPQINITSNLLDSTIHVKNIDGLWHADTVFTLPKNSLLPETFTGLRWERIAQIETKTLFEDNGATTKLQGDNLNGNIIIGYNQNIDGQLNLGNASLKAKGTGKLLDLSLETASLELFAQTLQQWITSPLQIPKGDIQANATIKENQISTISIASNELFFGDSKEPLTNLNAQITYDSNIWTLTSYETTYDGERIYATKPTSIEIIDNAITLNNLWINDQIQIQGGYNLQNSQGTFVTMANPFNIQTKWLELGGNLNLETIVDGNATTLKGTIDISQGNIRYNLEQKTFPSDEDIIVLQEQKEPSAFFQNLATSLKITTQSPITYRQGGASIDIIADLGIEKAKNSPLMVLGMVTLPKGGTYMFNDKRFALQESYIYFTGDPNKPMLDIKATHKSLNHQIRIAITGAPNAPNIIFSSTPRLSREQILSILLFDSESGADTHSGEEMMKMMGGAIAKSALADVGIAVDHLVLGGDSVEVGKKLTDKITVIYIDGEVSSVKVKYNHTRTVEGVVSVSPESTSVDIFYKKEVETLGDIIYSPKP